MGLFSIGQRVIVVEPEFDSELIDAGAAIPVGSIGIIKGNSERFYEYEPTGEECQLYQIVFDGIPYQDNGYWMNDGGFTKAELFEPMLAPFDGDESWTENAGESDLSLLFG